MDGLSTVTTQSYEELFRTKLIPVSEGKLYSKRTPRMVITRSPWQVWNNQYDF